MSLVTGHSPMTQPRYHDQDLSSFATALLQRAGPDQGKAAAVADMLVEANLLGHDTHGLALLPPYLNDIEAGAMANTGEPAIRSDRPAAMTSDGTRLPGRWLVDADGNPMDDPAVMFTEPKGAMLPLGGVDAGHEGYSSGTP